jgi:hypothetical protein
MARSANLNCDTERAGRAGQKPGLRFRFGFGFRVWSGAVHERKARLPLVSSSSCKSCRQDRCFRVQRAGSRCWLRCLSQRCFKLHAPFTTGRRFTGTRCHLPPPPRIRASLIGRGAACPRNAAPAKRGGATAATPPATQRRQRTPSARPRPDLDAGACMEGGGKSGMPSRESRETSAASCSSVPAGHRGRYLLLSTAPSAPLQLRCHWQCGCSVVSQSVEEGGSSSCGAAEAAQSLPLLRASGGSGEGGGPAVGSAVVQADPHHQPAPSRTPTARPAVTHRGWSGEEEGGGGRERPESGAAVLSALVPVGGEAEERDWVAGAERAEQQPGRLSCLLDHHHLRRRNRLPALASLTAPARTPFQLTTPLLVSALLPP